MGNPAVTSQRSEGSVNRSRRVELRKDSGYVHVMKYMGSKRELLPDIRAIINTLAPSGGTVLDLFAGTCSVGAYLKDRYSIVSNDVQDYSRVLAEALICSSRIELADSSTRLKSLRRRYLTHLKKLERLFPGILAGSEAFVETNPDAWTEARRKQYLRFLESFPSPKNRFRTGCEELRLLKRMFEERAAAPDKAPYCQTLFLFPETYFSVRQCMEIDSIRHALDSELSGSPLEHAIGLAALIHAHSYCSSGTGHFAMFRDLDTVESVTDAFIYRRRNVWEYFEKKFEELRRFHKPDPSKKHLARRMGFEEILGTSAIMRDVDVVYADPPYSFVHYSRFYHATESLVRYDYMLPEHKGRYRTDRHQSPFCQGKNVTAAFNRMFELVAKYAKPIILSYSDTGMIGMSEILRLLEQHGFATIVHEIAYDHSTMGRKGHRSNRIREYLVVGRPSRR